MASLLDADTRLSRPKRQTLVLCVLLVHDEVAGAIDCAMQSRGQIGVAHGREQTSLQRYLTAVGDCGDCGPHFPSTGGLGLPAGSNICLRNSPLA
jgi:hypothetical protein